MADWPKIAISVGAGIIGGSGAIGIFYKSLGKWFEQRTKATLDKELERYKHDLQRQLQFETQLRTAEAQRRWLRQTQFDIFQDVADCAFEYQTKNDFGDFQSRLVGKIEDIMRSLRHELAATLADVTYMEIYRSLSDAEYMLWAYDKGFERHYLAGYINRCLDSMFAAQNSLGDWPKARPNSAIEYMERSVSVTEIRPEL